MSDSDNKRVQERIDGLLGEIKTQTGAASSNSRVFAIAIERLVREIIHLEDQMNCGCMTIPDIRNKLTPLTHLISMIELKRKAQIEQALPQAKRSINYLADRKIYNI